jgi:hypothetical protein
MEEVEVESMNAEDVEEQAEDETKPGLSFM